MFDLVPFRRKHEDVIGSMLKPIHDWLDPHMSAPLSSLARPFRTDIRETDNAYIIEAEVPGFNKDEIEITHSNGYLTLKGLHRVNEEIKGHNDTVIRRERYHGEFVRRFYVGEIDEERIKAKLQNGVLQLEVPKKPHSERKEKRIRIE